MNSVSSVRSLMQMFDGKIQEFISDIDDVHMVWLEEIQQEANRMFSSDFSAEPELMPKTPSQKKNSRRKRVSLGRQEENQAKRRFSKGKRSNLRGSSVKTLNLISEDDPEASTSEASPIKPKRNTRRNKQTQPEVAVDAAQPSHGSCEESSVLNEALAMVEEEKAGKQSQVNNTETEREPDRSSSTAASPPKMPSPEVVVSISASDRLSAEMAKKPEASPGRTATKIAIAASPKSSRRSSVRHSLKLRHSLAGLRHSMTQESVRRASRRSLLKKKARMGDSMCSSNVSEDTCMESEGEENGEEMLAAGAADAEVNAEATAEEKMNQNTDRSSGRITRSMAVNSPTLAPSTLFTSKLKAGTPDKRSVASEKKPSSQSSLRSRQSTKRKAADIIEESPTKRVSPPKKSQSAMRPNMRSFLHTVQKNQMLMMTPSSLGRTAVIKSFIKHTTPLKSDHKLSSGGLVSRERLKLEALKKKQEQEEERMKKMEEDKKKKQDELRRKRDERLKRVVEARVKEEQKEEEKKKKIEQKMAQIDEKNDKLRVERLAEEKAKKKVALKRQEELEQRRKLEEEARRKKQAEEEKRQQELLAKRKAEEEEQRARKLAETRRALELKREQEREREKELERERQAAAERERAEKEKALALQRELERAAREKERRDLEEKRKELEERRKREEQQRLAAEERAAKEREAAKQREAAAKNVAAADVQTPAGKGATLNVTVDIERTVMKTPVGKGGGLNVTVDIEQSPQSYSITPKGGNKPVVLSKNPEDYGMDQNSDDSTDDESAPRKPIPSWAEGHNLQQTIMKQYFNPPDLDSFFGAIEPPKLENIFYKSKPRYFKRTSSAVWHSPPRIGNHF
ncbi:inner centromere protein isoform X3 [Centroberyx affinis]|uniref:inner centromere protein isoform X3 n=1 Tax=Centroberyx affinis TaxID=166261 RepID=UPI003A5C3771